jgi:glycosyltransferase involved in cell wall biosynthesis
MKIAIIVHGRFHAFDLAKALINRGHKITILTNYPKWAVAKFGIPHDRVKSFWLHGLVSRIFNKLSNGGLRWDPGSILNPIFGRWAARQLNHGTYDVVHAFSSVAEESMVAKSVSAHLVVRGSSHIAVQDRLLRDEELRSGKRMVRPSKALIAREEREYSKADRIVVLSTFARNSFISQGIPPDRLSLLCLGVNTAMFRASEDVLKARIERILGSARLRVLWVGAMSFRKGLLDFAEIVRALGPDRCAFRFVGDVSKDVTAIAKELESSVEIVPRQPQWDLPKQYAWADVFIFPTIEDGFAVVLAQARANGLPILTTGNCAGPDMIQEGHNGWILPIRDPRAFVDRLTWCDENREALAAMVTDTAMTFESRDWDDVAMDFEAICESATDKHGTKQGLAIGKV